MAKYRLKPDNVEAELFNGKNWFAVKRLLGPHLTKEEPVWEDKSKGFVFDVKDKMWLEVPEMHYVVKDAEGAIVVIPKEVFEATYEEEPLPSLFPTTPGVYPAPYPYRATFGGAVNG